MNALDQLQTLIDDNRTLLGIDCQQREVWLENGELKPGSNKTTDAGQHILDMEYRVCLAIERLHNAQTGLLVLLVHEFASGIDRDGLEDITFNVSPNDHRTVDVEFTLGVREPVHVVEVQNSPVTYFGKKVGFGKGLFTIAETLASVTTDRKA